MSASLLTAQNSLQVEMTNLRNNKGEVSVALLDKDKNTVEGKTVLIKDMKCTVIFKNLKTANYAIQYFHDENKNKELDKNKLGIPKEGIGFSNDAMGKFGPKKYEKWLIKVSGNKKIKITTKYLF